MYNTAGTVIRFASDGTSANVHTPVIAQPTGPLKNFKDFIRMGAALKGKPRPKMAFKIAFTMTITIL